MPQHPDYHTVNLTATHPPDTVYFLPTGQEMYISPAHTGLPAE